MGDPGLFRIRIHGGGAEKIADLKDFHDAGWLVYGAGSDRRAAAAARRWKRRYLRLNSGPEIALHRKRA